MKISPSWVTCDGCGVPASPAHIAERLSRLELATRFRPVHINVLFIAEAPSIRPEDDFYRPPESRKFFDPFLEALEISVPQGKIGAEADPAERDKKRLVEFQRRGYYLSYLSECPLSEQDDNLEAAISRLAPTLIRRVRLNYRPRQIAILGSNLNPLCDIFEKAGMSEALFPILEIPKVDDPVSAARFKAALASLAARHNLASGYDRIALKQT